MRWLAIGDIHGHLAALETLLSKVAPQPGDMIVTLGDYVDRGPNVRGVIDLLREWESRGQLIPLIGNHELIMLEARSYDYDFWQEVGGRETLASYASGKKQPGKLSDVPAEHWTFMEELCGRWFETEDAIFVHAGVDSELPLKEQDDFDLCWKKFIPALVRPHVSGKRVICGHTAQKSGIPLNLGHHVCIDTWVYGGGWLTCLDVETGHYWQANSTGEVREDDLADPPTHDPGKD